MGKSIEGAIWLSKKMLSPYNYWQFWRNTEDEDVVKFLKLFTEIDLKEIDKLSNLSGAEINDAKIILANHATEMAHGKIASREAEKTSKSTFKEENSGDSLPTVIINHATLTGGIPAYKVFSLDNILCSSYGEAKRLIKQGGAKINNLKINDENMTITDKFLDAKEKIKLSAGSKRHILIKIK